MNGWERLGRTIVGLVVGFVLWVGGARLGMAIDPDIAVITAAVGMFVGINVALTIIFPRES